MNMQNALLRCLLAVVAVGLLIGFQSSPAQAISMDVVISQVYGGDGNSGATYTNDFIEIFNLSSTNVSLAGCSLQYASAIGTGDFGLNFTQITPLPSVSLQPGQYFLILEAQGAGGTTARPNPYVTDTQYCEHVALRCLIIRGYREPKPAIM